MSERRLKIFGDNLSRNLPPNEVVGSSEHESWFVPHPLVIVNSPIVKGELPDPEVSKLSMLAAGIFAQIGDEFRKRIRKISSRNGTNP